VAIHRTDLFETLPRRRLEGHIAVGTSLVSPDLESEIIMRPFYPLLLVTLAMAALGVQRGHAQAAPDAAGPGVADDLARLRAATAGFRDIAAAQAAGYPTATPPCLANPPAGGMGHHYVNRAHVDGRLELERPEILLYAPDGSGKLKLVAVEYIIPYRILPPESEAPRIFGQALRQSDQLKLWYLHVWAWEENPGGLFADWNPAVIC